jgi:hypothetical protein
MQMRKISLALKVFEKKCSLVNLACDYLGIVVLHFSFSLSAGMCCKVSSRLQLPAAKLFLL